MISAKNQKILGLLMVMPSFLLIVLTVAIPVGRSIWISFQTSSGAFTFDNYLNLFVNKNNRANIIYTMQVVLFTVAITIIVSYLLALYFTFTDTWFSRTIGKLYLIPRFIPGIVAIYGMMAIVKDTGAINRFFSMFGLDVKLNLMYTIPGLVVTNLWFNIPFATMLISSGLASIPRSIIESAKDVGADNWTILRKMIFPLSAKSVLIATTFVFMGNVGSFTTPFLMGANYPRMLGVALYNEFTIYNKHNSAAAISIVMFIISSFMGAIYVYDSMKEEKWENNN